MAVPWKAVYAFIISFCVALVGFLQDKTSLETMTALQWTIAVLSSVIVASGVYVLPK